MTNKFQHSGIKGMRWGIRRYQNKDGSLTPAGKKRYGDGTTNRTKHMTSKGRSQVQNVLKGIGKATVVSAGVLAAAKVGKKLVKYAYLKSIKSFLDDIDF